MSRRRGDVAVPLVTLVVSFLVVLLLGQLVGRDSAGSTETESPAGVHLVLHDLNISEGGLKPFPGLDLSISPRSRTNGEKQDGEGRVNICMSTGSGWRPDPSNPEWKQSPGTTQSGTTQFCREVRSVAGRIDGVEIWLVRS